MPTLTRATDVLPDLRASLLLSATMAVTGVAASDAPLPAWQPLRRELVTSSKGTLSVDDVVYGYDQLYEHNQLWAQQRFMGVQCQQDPMDAWVLQEILFDTQPDLLIETGTQNGGGALMYATLMTWQTCTDGRVRPFCCVGGLRLHGKCISPRSPSPFGCCTGYAF